MNQNTERKALIEGPREAFAAWVIVMGVILLLIYHEHLLEYFFPYEPTEQEIADRPDFLARTHWKGHETVSIKKEYFGVLYHLSGVHRRRGADPLHAEVPDSVSINRTLASKIDSYSTSFLVQEIPTSFSWKNNWKDAPKVRLNQKILVIDNATSDELSIEIGGHSYPKLGAFTHGIVFVPEHQRFQMKVTSSKLDASSVVLPIYLTEKDKGFTNRSVSFYVYNHQGKNEYSLVYKEFDKMYK